MRRRGAIALLAAAAIGVIALLAIRWAIAPATLGPRALAAAGRALDLHLQAEGFDYRLRGTPQLTLRQVRATSPATGAAVFSADRVFVSLPWSTLRTRGATPVLTRITLDAPHINLAAARHWWDARPAGTGDVPTVRDGVQIRRGTLDGGDWQLQHLDITLAHLSADAPVRASMRGVLSTDALQMPLHLHLATHRPALPTGIGLAGTLSPRTTHGRSTMRITLGSHLGINDQAIALRALQVSAHGHLRTGAHGAHPFALGLAADTRHHDGTLQVAPLSLVLRAGAWLPQVRLRGALSAGQQLSGRLEGTLAHWPQAWPALPAPLSDASGPLTFQLGYDGNWAFDTPLALELTYDSAHFSGQLRPTAVRDWLDDPHGAPLPPLNGELQVPQITLDGVQLQGIEITFEDDADPAARP